MQSDHNNGIRACDLPVALFFGGPSDSDEHVLHKSSCAWINLSFSFSSSRSLNCFAGAAESQIQMNTGNNFEF